LSTSLRPVPQAPDSDVSPELLLRMHDLMLKSRILEERLIAMYKQGDGYFWIGGPGEEAFNVPLGLLTGWIHAVATVNPTTALLEAGRGFIAGRPTSVVLAFAVGAGLALLFTAWARGGLRRAESAG